MTAPVKKSVHPTTFDELLDACPELRYVRYLSMQDLQTLLGRAVDECAWCGTQIPDWKPGRKTCKRECSEHLKERCCDRTKKQMARERDQGLCQICGRDTGLAQRAAERAWEERTGTKCATDSQELERGRPHSARHRGRRTMHDRQSTATLRPVSPQRRH
jgi:hypothetical protein